MRVAKITDIESLEPLAPAWGCLTHGVPFRSWEWLRTWWKHYQGNHCLSVLAVFDTAENLVGIAPFYVESSGSRGKVLHFLGSGEVCSDYMTILSTTEFSDQVTDAIGDWLVQAATSGPREDRWDVMQLEGVASTDIEVAKLVALLSESGCSIHRAPDLDCWQLDLPETWEEFRASFSKNGRKRLKRLERTINEEGIEFHVAATLTEFERGMRILVDLHQKRRQSLHQAGCFHSTQFSAFLAQASLLLWERGMLQVSWIEDDKQRPLAAEFSLRENDSIFLYQSGIETDALSLSPGHLITNLLIKQAIADGIRKLDFLRGDESYKSTWGGKRQPVHRIRVAAHGILPQVRHGVWLAGHTMKHLVRSGLSLTGMSPL